MYRKTVLKGFNFEIDASNIFRDGRTYIAIVLFQTVVVYNVSYDHISGNNLVLMPTMYPSVKFSELY